MAFGTSGKVSGGPPQLNNQNSFSQAGERVTNPKAIIAIALKNQAANTPPSPLAQALAKRKKGKNA